MHLQKPFRKLYNVTLIYTPPFLDNYFTTRSNPTGELALCSYLPWVSLQKSFFSGSWTAILSLFFFKSNFKVENEICNIMILTSLLIYHVNKYLSNNNKKKLCCSALFVQMFWYLYIISFFVDNKYQNVCEKIRPWNLETSR